MSRAVFGLGGSAPVRLPLLAMAGLGDSSDDEWSDTEEGVEASKQQPAVTSAQIISHQPSQLSVPNSTATAQDSPIGVGILSIIPSNKDNAAVNGVGNQLPVVQNSPSVDLKTSVPIPPSFPRPRPPPPPPRPPPTVNQQLVVNGGDSSVNTVGKDLEVVEKVNNSVVGDGSRPDDRTDATNSANVNRRSSVVEHYPQVPTVPANGVDEVSTNRRSSVVSHQPSLNESTSGRRSSVFTLPATLAQKSPDVLPVTDVITSGHGVTHSPTIVPTIPNATTTIPTEQQQQLSSVVISTEQDGKSDSTVVTELPFTRVPIPSSVLNAHLIQSSSTLPITSKAPPLQSPRTQFLPQWTDKLRSLAKSCISTGTPPPSIKSTSPTFPPPLIDGTGLTAHGRITPQHRTSAVIKAIRKRREARQAGYVTNSDGVLAALTGTIPTGDSQSHSRPPVHSVPKSTPFPSTIPSTLTVTVPTIDALLGRSRTTSGRDDGGGSVNTPVAMSPFVMAVQEPTIPGLKHDMSLPVFSQVDLLSKDGPPSRTKSPLQVEQQSKQQELQSSGSGLRRNRGIAVSFDDDDNEGESVVYGAGGNVSLRLPGTSTLTPLRTSHGPHDEESWTHAEAKSDSPQEDDNHENVASSPQRQPQQRDAKLSWLDEMTMDVGTHDVNVAPHYSQIDAMFGSESPVPPPSTSSHVPSTQTRQDDIHRQLQETISPVRMLGSVSSPDPKASSEQSTFNQPTEFKQEHKPFHRATATAMQTPIPTPGKTPITPNYSSFIHRMFPTWPESMTFDGLPQLQSAVAGLTSTMSPAMRHTVRGSRLLLHSITRSQATATSSFTMTSAFPTAHVATTPTVLYFQIQPGWPSPLLTWRESMESDVIVGSVEVRRVTAIQATTAQSPTPPFSHAFVLTAVQQAQAVVILLSAASQQDRLMWCAGLSAWHAITPVANTS